MKYMKDKNLELVVKIESWDHTCADGCCYYSGKDIFVNDKKLDIEDSDPSERVIIEEILKHLGYTNVNVIENYET